MWKNELYSLREKRRYENVRPILTTWSLFKQICLEDLHLYKWCSVLNIKTLDFAIADKKTFESVLIKLKCIWEGYSIHCRYCTNGFFLFNPNFHSVFTHSAIMMFYQHKTLNVMHFLIMINVHINIQYDWYVHECLDDSIQMTRVQL